MQINFPNNLCDEAAQCNLIIGFFFVFYLFIAISMFTVLHLRKKNSTTLH